MIQFGSWVAIYFIVWWLVLFAVLPVGVKNAHEAGESTEAGNDPGAPVLPMMAKKLIWTTLISAVLFGAGMSAYRMGWLDLDRMTSWMGLNF